VHKFIHHPAIEPTLIKQKGMTTHFHQSHGVDGIGGLHACQKACNLPETRPVQEVEVRWSSGFNSMEWYRSQQRAVQHYDVNHSRKAGDAYRQHQMDLSDWRINEQSVGVLQPVADWTQLMEGTKGYPTMPLVLPTVYNIIEITKPAAPLIFDFPGMATPTQITAGEMIPGVLDARTDFHEDWVDRFVTNLDPVAKRQYAIATLFHPYFKAYDFVGSTAQEKMWALSEMRNEWLFTWKPKATAAETATAPEQQPGSSASHATKKRKVSLGSVLGAIKKEKETTADGGGGHDELEEYLASPDVTDIDDFDLLKWWKAKESTWPALSKMAKQYLAAPASSAGVERVFSAAGKMHSDLRKSMSDESMKHSLFASFNTK
jgi:hypothetical protein